MIGWKVTLILVLKTDFFHTEFFAGHFCTLYIYCFTLKNITQLFFEKIMLPKIVAPRPTQYVS